MKTFRVLFPLACLFLFRAPLLHAAPGGDAPDLLHDVARKSSNIQTLSADFQQQKKLSVLARPLLSEGYICVSTRGADTRLLWAYTKPEPSGFLYENGKGSLWQKHMRERRETDARETEIIAAITRHALSWVHVDPDAVRNAYRVESQGEAELVLVPRRKTFFSRMRVQFTPTRDSLSRLTFLEDNGDATSISFSQTVLNKPLPSRCAAE